MHKLTNAVNNRNSKIRSSSLFLQKRTIVLWKIFFRNCVLRSLRTKKLRTSKLHSKLWQFINRANKNLKIEYYAFRISGNLWNIRSIFNLESWYPIR